MKTMACLFLAIFGLSLIPTDAEARRVTRRSYSTRAVVPPPGSMYNSYGYGYGGYYDNYDSPYSGSSYYYGQYPYGGTSSITLRGSNAYYGMYGGYSPTISSYYYGY